MPAIKMPHLSLAGLQRCLIFCQFVHAPVTADFKLPSCQKNISHFIWLLTPITAKKKKILINKMQKKNALDKNAGKKHIFA